MGHRKDSTFLSEKMAITPKWIISDTHFGHLNIISHCQRPWECDKLMIDAWSEMIQPRDVVLHLGDVVFPAELVRHWVKKLPGEVYFLRGNHDKKNDQIIVLEAKWKMLAPFTLEVEGWNIMFSHYPLLDLPPQTLNLHGHIHNQREPDIFHVNCSVEQTNYKPLLFEEIIKERLAIINTPSLRTAYELEKNQWFTNLPERSDRDEGRNKALRMKEQMRQMGILLPHDDYIRLDAIFPTIGH